jgi:hypothetical protein
LPSRPVPAAKAGTTSPYPPYRNYRGYWSWRAGTSARRLRSGKLPWKIITKWGFSSGASSKFAPLHQFRRLMTSNNKSQDSYTHHCVTIFCAKQAGFIIQTFHLRWSFLPTKVFKINRRLMLKTCLWARMSAKNTLLATPASPAGELAPRSELRTRFVL